MRIHLGIVPFVLLASAAVQQAAALVPPMQSACYLPDNKGCQFLNSYECDDIHGAWHQGEACPPAQTPPPR